MATSKPLRVLIADDHDDLRLLARVMLEADDRFEVAGEAVDGLDAVERTRQERPDVVLLDADMPRLRGVDAIPKLLGVHPETRIVMFTAHADQCGTAVGCGAVAILEKGRSVTDLPDALASALADTSGPAERPTSNG